MSTINARYVSELPNLQVADEDTIQLRQYDAAFAGGGGHLRYDATSTTPVDNGLVFAAPGGVGRYLRSWDLNGIDPQWFGVDTSGGADATAALKAVLDYAALVGTHVRLSGTLNLATWTEHTAIGNLDLRGSATLNGPGGVNFIANSGSNVVKLDGQTFNGFTHLEFAGPAHVKNVTVNTPTEDGIVMSGDNSSISDVTINTPQLSPIKLNGATNIRINRVDVVDACKFYENTYNGSTAGTAPSNSPAGLIRMNNCSRILVDDVYCNRSFLDGLAIDTCDHIEVSNVYNGQCGTLGSNQLGSGGGECYSMRIKGSSHVRVTKSTFLKNQLDGCVVMNNDAQTVSKYVSIEDNHVDEVLGVNGSTAQGIGVNGWGQYGLAVRRNVISHCGWQGIQTLNGQIWGGTFARYNSAVENFVFECGKDANGDNITTTHGDGIQYGGGYQHLVLGNMLVNHHRNGITLKNTVSGTFRAFSDCTVLGNMIADCAVELESEGNGINIQEQTGADTADYHMMCRHSVVANNIMHCYQGIHVNGASINTFMGNAISDSRRYAFWEEGTAGYNNHTGNIVMGGHWGVNGGGGDILIGPGTPGPCHFVNDTWIGRDPVRQFLTSDQFYNLDEVSSFHCASSHLWTRGPSSNTAVSFMTDLANPNNQSVFNDNDEGTYEGYKQLVWGNEAQTIFTPEVQDRNQGASTGGSSVLDLGDVSGAADVDFATATYVTATVIGDTVFDFQNIPENVDCTILIEMGGTGSYSVEANSAQATGDTFGFPPILRGSVGAKTLLTFQRDDTDIIWVTDMTGSYNSEYTFLIQAGGIPASGQVLRDADPAESVANIHISSTNEAGNDLTAFLKEVSTGDRIKIAEAGDAARNELFEVSGPAVDQGTYFIIPVINGVTTGDLRDNRVATVTFTVT